MRRGGALPHADSVTGVPVPDFVLRLREKVGHDPLWLAGVTAVVLHEERVLLVRRSDNGKWSPVTGIVDPGEHPATTATREAHEETGVHVEVEGLAWVSVTPPTVHANGDRAQYLDHTFRCRYVGGEARVADDESVAVGWFALDALPQMDPVLVERITTAVAHAGTTRLH
jgi:ADP-ribose pyrophosphatase YjhB (NUDIX family)